MLVRLVVWKIRSVHRPRNENWLIYVTMNAKKWKKFPARTRPWIWFSDGCCAAGACSARSVSSRAPTATMLPLADARQAHALQDEPAFIGKIVLHP